MITAGERWRNRLTRLGVRYEDWELRVRQRLSGWSRRRKLAVFVLLPLLLCCGGSGVAVPLVWFVRETAEAGRGAVSPDAAANAYLMALGYDNDEGLLVVLDDEHQGELLAQWRAYRDAMKGTDPPPSRLDFGALDVGPVVAGRAEVTTDVAASWWGTSGRTTSYSSGERRWRFETRDDGGWRVSLVEAPAWCGGYVRVERCRPR